MYFDRFDIVEAYWCYFADWHGGQASAEYRRLSGMGQLVGYGVGALGPLAVGALFALGGSWTLPLAFLVVLVVVQGAVLLLAGRPGTLQARG